MYELTIQRSFHASHALKLADGSREPMHAHDWHTVAHVVSDRLDDHDLVIDFHELQAMLDRVLAPMTNVTLNDMSAFASVNPSAERVAEHIARTLMDLLPPRVRLLKLTVTEAPDCTATYHPG